MRWSASRFILSLLSRVSFLTLVYGSCDQLESEFSLFTLEDLLRNSAVRAVGTRNTPGADIPTCLCRETPCSTPRYALLGDSKSTNNVSLIFSPGVHELDEGLPILNSNYIALVGVGDFPHDTVIGCGNLDEDDYNNCRLKHIDIHNSTHVYIVGITFDKCHPFIAGIHVQNSEHIVFENCTFRWVFACNIIDIMYVYTCVLGIDLCVLMSLLHVQKQSRKCCSSIQCQKCGIS